MSKTTLNITIISLGLAVITLALYWPAISCEFLDLDDAEFVANNTYIQQGITKQGLAWVFDGIHFNYWQPITWLSFMFDVEIFGQGPRGHHLASVLLHTINTLLVFWVFTRMTGSMWSSAFLAALFAVHPLRLEAVVWISDRKDLLCALFWLLGIGAYTSYARKPSGGRMVVVFLCMLLGLMSKQMIVTFPFVLLLLDYWPLQRIRMQDAGCEIQDEGSHPFSHSPILLLFREKLPLFALTLIFCISTYVLHPYSGPGGRIMPSFLARLVRIPGNYGFYLAKAVLPVNLCVAYPRPTSVDALSAVIATLLLLAITASILWLGRRERFLPVGWFWFLGTLVPVIGFVWVGNTDVADRFTYMPLMGAFIIVAWGVPAILKRAPVATLTAITLLAGAAWGTRTQLPNWRDTRALSRRALNVTEDNFIAWNSMGRVKELRGDLPGAAKCYAESLAVAPRFSQAHLNMANVLGLMKRYGEAKKHFEFVLEQEPENAKAHSSYGSILFSAGSKDEGIEHLQESVHLDPSLPNSHFNLAWALLQAKRADEALRSFEEAVRLNPSDDLALFWAGGIHMQYGEHKQAEAYFQKCVELMPDKKEYADLLQKARESKSDGTTSATLQLWQNAK